jgi:hypothetical protein
MRQLADNLIGNVFLVGGITKCYKETSIESGSRVCDSFLERPTLHDKLVSAHANRDLSAPPYLVCSRRYEMSDWAGYGNSDLTILPSQRKDHMSVEVNFPSARFIVHTDVKSFI